MRREFRADPQDPNSLTIRLNQHQRTVVIDVLYAKHQVGSVRLTGQDAHVRATLESAEPTSEDTTRLLRAPTPDELRLRYLTLIDRLSALGLEEAITQRILANPHVTSLQEALKERAMEPRDGANLRAFARLVEAAEQFAILTAPTPSGASAATQSE